MRLTKSGAKEVTSTIDRIAGLVQDQHNHLGLSQEDAIKVALVLDSLSDTIEKTAGLDRTPVDETGASVGHGQNGFDANAVGDEVPGPVEIVEPPNHSDIDDHFTQVNFQELRRLQQSGTLEANAAKGVILTKTARKALVACGTGLSSHLDKLKILHTKIKNSPISDAADVAPSLKKQIKSVSEVHDYLLECEAMGHGDVTVVNMANTIMQAIGEELPYLEQIAAGFDPSSPVDAYNFMKLINDGSLAELVDVATTMIEEQATLLIEEGEEQAEEEDEEEVEYKFASKKASPAKPNPAKKASLARRVFAGEEEEKKEFPFAKKEAPEEAAPKKAAPKKASFYGFNLFS